MHAFAACALLISIAPASRAEPEEPLIAALAGDLRAPQLRCEWIAGEFDTLERQLSLYREELASIYVAVDGRTIIDSAGGAILAVEFDTWRTGPASMAIAIDASRLQYPALLTPGRPHPLFCGELTVLRTDAAGRRKSSLSLRP